MNIKGVKRAVSYMLAIVVALLPVTAVPVWADTCESGHEMTHHDAVAATCTVPGNIEYWECTDCEPNQYYKVADGIYTTDADTLIIPATGHSWNAGELTQAPTCTEAGVRTFTCTHEGCNETSTEAIAALGHNMAEHTAVATTCLAAGNSAYWSCDRCDKYFSDAEGNTEIAANSWVIAATGHSWGTPTYEWAAGYSTVTAIKPCLNDVAHSITETVTATSEVAIAATCITEGSVTYSATFTNGDFSEQTTTVAIAPLGHNMTEHAAVAAICLAAGNSAYWSCDRCGKYFSDAGGNTEIAENSWVIPATGHSWGTPTYEWAADYSSVTATSICTANGEHVTTEAVSVTTGPGVAPTCESAGYYLCTSAAFTSDVFTLQTTEVAIAALGHDWGTPTYEWAADYRTVTATSICARDDCNETMTEMVNATPQDTTPAGCETTGVRTYTSEEFTTPAVLGMPTTTTAIIPATGHSWGEATYTWNDSKTVVTAERRCNNDQSHVETTTAEAIASITRPATCTEEGIRTYTATFTSPFGTQTTTEAIAMIDHTYGDVSYVWAEDHLSATATATCTACGHTVSETTDAAMTNSSPTCTEAGRNGYTVTFANTVLGADTYGEVVQALGHSWGAVIYTWGPDNVTARAIRTCERDPNHRETEEVYTTSQASIPATCEDGGVILFTAHFENAAFGEQTTTSAGVALGHSWGTPTYTWAADYSSVTATSICARTDCNETMTEMVNATPQDTTPAGCETTGVRTYTSEEFTTPAVLGMPTTTTAIIPATGHSWGEATYTWNDSKTVVTAERRCIYDSSHVETTTAEAIASITRQATCTEAGIRTYTATFTSPFETQTTTEAIAMIDHTYGEPTYTWATDNSTATAVHTCTVCGHVESQTVASSNEPIAATCETQGSTGYTAHFTIDGFADQVIGTTTPALGHNWGTPTYTWSADKSTITATRTCSRDGSHTDTEQGSITSREAVSPTCTSPGERTYTATFTHEGLTTQTTTAAIPALGHDFSGTGTVTLQPTCTQAGVRTFTCTHGCGATSTEAIAALGHHMDEHVAVAATCGNAGNSAYWYCDRCGRYFSDASGNTVIAVDSWVIPATGAHTLVHQAAVTPLATAAGNIDNWECSVCHKHFSDEHGTSEITANGWIIPATGGGSSGGGGGGGSAVSDGSSTGAVPAKDGTVTNSDGSTTTTTTADDGSRTAVTTAKDGSATSVTLTKDGSTGTVVTDKNGNTVSAEAAPSQKAVEQAAAAGEPVKLAVEVKASADSSKAAPIAVSLPKNVNADNPVKVEIPVENAGPSTVVVIVSEDGTEEIVKSSTITDDGAAVMLGGSATIKIVENEKVFSDVPDYEWYVKEVAWASSHELMNGGGDGRFAADDLTSHGMVTQILFNLEGATLSEAEMAELNVTDETWFIPSFTWAEKVGVAEGYSEDFDMNRAITREQLACMLFNYAQYKGYDTSVRSDISAFPDAEGTSFWAAEQLSWAVGIGLMNGIADEEGNVTLASQGSTTRAMVAAMLERFCEKVIR